uniref:Uncharacterized protein n=1 Tax=Knipowitschia caucasica TaxID=637954 RepID=A0AAV2M4G9_KNICA
MRAVGHQDVADDSEDTVDPRRLSSGRRNMHRTSKRTTKIKLSVASNIRAKQQHLKERGGLIITVKFGAPTPQTDIAYHFELKCSSSKRERRGQRATPVA